MRFSPGSKQKDTCNLWLSRLAKIDTYYIFLVKLIPLKFTTSQTWNKYWQWGDVESISMHCNIQQIANSYLTIPPQHGHTGMWQLKRPSYLYYYETCKNVTVLYRTGCIVQCIYSKVHCRLTVLSSSNNLKALRISSLESFSLWKTMLKIHTKVKRIVTLSQEFV